MLYGNFDTLIGIPNPWTNTKERNHAYYKGVFLLIIFSIVALLNLISIVRTIRTPPGGIPEDKEWDMQSDSSVIEQSSEDESHNQESEIKEEKKEE